MPYTRKKSEVTEEMPCKQCDAWIASDEEAWIDHCIIEHGVTPGSFAHNLTRMYPDPSRKRAISS